MRTASQPPRRLLLLVVAAATSVAAAVLPGAISAGQQPAAPGLPSSSQVISIVDGRPGIVAAPASATRGPTQPRVPTPTRPTAEVEAAVEPDTDPSTWVASVDVLGFGETEPAIAAGDPLCPSAKTCERTSVREQKWKTSEDGTVTIPWRFNDEGRRSLRAPEGLLESAVSGAMAEWSRWNSNIDFAYEGTTAATFGATGADGSCADGVNTITWTRFDPSIIAAVGTCIDPATNTIRDADLALNVTQHWEHIVGEAESRHTFDIRSIVTHELGHMLSLLDLYDRDALHQTMMGNAEYGETRKRTLAMGDIIGVQRAYPCGESDTCPREGIVDD